MTARLMPKHAGFGGHLEVPIPAWKKLLDIVLAGAALIAVSPLFLVTAILIRTTSAGPILFRQIRIGRGGRPFTMFKFRTMYNLPNEKEELAHRQAFRRELTSAAEPNPSTSLFREDFDRRVTPLGRILRVFSVDELPQLLNVLRGEMSLVGPRPLLPAEAQMLSAVQRNRHAVLPGMTGLWQVSGRNRISSLAMIQIDLEYISHLSIWLDLFVLIRTPYAVLFDRHTR